MRLRLEPARVYWFTGGMVVTVIETGHSVKIGKTYQPEFEVYRLSGSSVTRIKVVAPSPEAAVEKAEQMMAGRPKLVAL